MQKKFILLIVLINVFSGCASFKKVKTITETITKIDTVIVVKKDTITLTNSVSLYDTVYLENSTAKAKSYYNFGTKKLILELTGKSFEVPIKVNSKNIVTTITKEKKETFFQRNYDKIIFFGAGLFFIWFFNKK